MFTDILIIVVNQRNFLTVPQSLSASLLFFICAPLHKPDICVENSSLFQNSRSVADPCVFKTNPDGNAKQLTRILILIYSVILFELIFPL